MEHRVEREARGPHFGGTLRSEDAEEHEVVAAAEERFVGGAQALEMDALFGAEAFPSTA